MDSVASFTSANWDNDTIIAGNADDLIGERITLIMGQNLTRGAVLGKITASGKYTLSTAGASDGSQIPDAILAETTDAGAADTSTLAYIRGDFIEQRMILGAGHTIASIKEGLRIKNIQLVKAIL